MLLQDRGLISAFKLVPKTLVTYLMHVEDHYRYENPYHNSTHAADVAQSSHVLLSLPFLEVRVVIIRVDLTGVYSKALTHASEIGSRDRRHKFDARFRRQFFFVPKAVNDFRSGASARKTGAGIWRRI